MMKQQEEIQQVYDKYGTSMSAGCLPLLIQMPLLFALYPVIYNIQKYVPEIKTASKSSKCILTLPDLTISPMQMIKNSGDYGFAPVVIIITAILLPVLSGLTQYGSIKLSQAISGQQLDKDNPMGIYDEHDECDNAAVLGIYGIFTSDRYRSVLDRQCGSTLRSADIYQ